MSIYNPGVPSGTVKLDQDYKNLQNNFSQLDTTFGVDHTKVSANPTAPGKNGYHTVIHQIPYVGPPTDPAKITGIGQIYQKITNGDTQLFYETGLGGISQITGYSASASGYQYIGGVLLQWGTGSFGNIVFTYGIPFPNNIFNVQVTPVAQTGNNIKWGLSSVGKVNFSLLTSYVTPPNPTPTFYWLAIGN